MNDHELDRLVAEATHVRDSWVAGFDLRAADDQLMEEIMATTDTPAFPGSGPPDGPGPLPEGPSPLASEPRPGRRRFTPAVALGAAAALLAGVVLARSTMGADGGSETGDVGTSGIPMQDLPEAEPPPGAAHRELAGGDQVWSWVHDDGWLCYASDVGAGIMPVCTSDSPTSVSVLRGNNGQQMLDALTAVGIAPDGTASIDGGETTFGAQVEGGRLFVWESTGGEDPGAMPPPRWPDALTFRDAEGNEIATHQVSVTCGWGLDAPPERDVRPDGDCPPAASHRTGSASGG